MNKTNKTPSKRRPYNNGIILIALSSLPWLILLSPAPKDIQLFAFMLGYVWTPAFLLVGTISIINRFGVQKAINTNQKVSIILASIITVAIISISAFVSFKVTTKTFDLSDFSDVRITGFDVEIVQSDTYSITVTADDMWLIDVKKDRDKNRDYISISKHSPFYSPMRSTIREVKITMPDLKGLTLGSGSNAIIHGFSSTDNFDLYVSGRSTLNGDMVADKVYFEIRGAQSSIWASTVKLKGSAESMFLSVGGWSIARLAEFEVVNADIRLYQATAEVNVSGVLNALLQVGSNLTYIGNPTIGEIIVSDDSIINLPLEDIIVTIPDPKLEAVIRETINKPQGSIYINDLELLTTLEAKERGISVLTGLEYCVNLRELRLGDNNISDLSPLAGLTDLELLWIWSNNISDISPLAGLENLEQLNFVYNSVSDISPLSGLTDLYSLGIGQNNIADISALAGLMQLRYLNLLQNDISDISFLANLTNLTTLSLGGNQIRNISPLANLTNLTTLELNSNGFSNISPLANLTNLTELFLINNQISDISPLVDNRGLSAGDTIDLRSNPLNNTSVNVYIPQLEARGVTVQR